MVHGSVVSPVFSAKTQETLWIDDLAMIFYSGNDTAECSPKSFSLSVVGEPFYNDKTFFA